MYRLGSDNVLARPILFLVVYIVTDHISITQAHTCEVGQEHDDNHIWRWVLQYNDPCMCTRIVYGGANTQRPKRRYKPVYVDTPLATSDINKIRKHYNLKCIDLKCPPTNVTSTDPGKATALVQWTHPVTADATDKTYDATCLPSMGTNFTIGTSTVVCQVTDWMGNKKTCHFDIIVKDNEKPIFKTCPANRTSNTEPGQSIAMINLQDLRAYDNSGDIPPVVCNPPSGTFAIGFTPVTCVASDGYGNNESCTFYVDVKDNEDLVITACPENQTKNTDQGLPTAIVIWDDPVTTDNSGDIKTVTCEPPSGSYLTLGSTQVSCTAVDRYGNEDKCTFFVNIEDNEDPVITVCPENQTKNTVQGLPTAVVIWDDPVATDNSGDIKTVTCKPPSGSILTLGSTQVNCTAVDGYGNEDKCTFFVEVEDNEDPVITACPENQTKNTDQVLPTAIVIWDDPVATDNSGDIKAVTCEPPSGSNLTLGSTQVNCTAVDGYGNEDKCTFFVEVEDNEVPGITACPENQTQDTDPGLPSAMVIWDDPVATDNSGDIPTVTCESPSASNFTIGSTTVICTAVDGYGNENHCSFFIVIEDNEDPVITACPENKIQSNDTGMSTAVVIWEDPVANDNSRDSLTYTCQPPSGSTFDTGGSTEVICTAEDGYGNEDKCSFLVFFVEFEGDCLNQLGMQYGQIKNEQITASSAYVDPNCPPQIHGAYYARLGTIQTANNCGGWCAPYNDSSHWIQVNLRGVMRVTGVMIQGRSGHDQWVTNFKVRYRMYGAEWMTVQMKDGSNMIFGGNTDQDSVVIRLFPTPIRAQLIRIRPRQWHGHACMRFELLGCAECLDQLGMQYGRIANEQITASSVYVNTTMPLRYHGTYHARLGTIQTDDNCGGWCAGDNNAHQWIQVNLRGVMLVTGVVIQRRNLTAHWVTKFKVFYRMYGAEWMAVKTEGGEDMVFDGNSNQNSTVIRYFPTPVRASLIRIQPHKWHNHVCMRFELLGCADSKWHLAFKAVSNITEAPASGDFDEQDPFQVWQRPEAFNEDNPEARQLDTVYKGHYKSPIVKAWETSHIDQVMVVLLDDIGTEFATFLFNGDGSNNSNWFSPERLLLSPYEDIARKDHSFVGNYFSIEGDNVARRRWFINKNYGGCPIDRGWLAVAYNFEPPCSWENRGSSKPIFLFSLRNNSVNWNSLNDASPLGLQDRRVGDQQITASSNYTLSTVDRRLPQYGRLHNDSFWAPLAKDRNPWIQVDFRSPVGFTGIKTQGAGKNQEAYVTKLSVKGGRDENSLTPIMESGIEKIFDANVNGDDVEYIEFPVTVFGRLLHIIPRAWNNTAAMRIEVIGYYTDVGMADIFAIFVHTNGSTET